MAVDSCSMHKLGLIGREISLTLTVAVRPTSAAACHLKWHCCNFRQQRANTLSINYMVECALVQQTHTVNTYVSCRSSLHSNPQHSNTCLLRSTSPKVGCFHGNQAAAFDDGSHEMTPADNAGSSEREDGRMCGWVSVGLQREIMEKEKDNYFSQKSCNRSTARFFFPAGAVYLALKQAAAGTRRTRWGIAETAPSHIRVGMIHMPHVDLCVIKKSVIKFFCLGCEVKRNVWREVHAPPSASLFYIRPQTDKCESVRILSSFAFMPLALQSFGNGNTTHIFHFNSLCQLMTFLLYQNTYHVWEILLHQEQTVCG